MIAQTHTALVLDRLRTEQQMALNGDMPILANSFRLAIEEIERLQKALLKVRSYNSDILAERMNYRPLDHIQVIDDAFSSQKRGIDR